MTKAQISGLLAKLEVGKASGDVVTVDDGNLRMQFAVGDAVMAIDEVSKVEFWQEWLVLYSGARVSCVKQEDLATVTYSKKPKRSVGLRPA